MTISSLQVDVETVCAFVKSRMRVGERTLVGIAGPPASGKSTLAAAVVKALNAAAATPMPQAALLPMDGYHLDNRLLEARGLLARKGAPETFDAEGFCDAVANVKTASREMFFPEFDRHRELAIASSIAIRPDTPVVVVEGNYLLLDRAPWSRLKELFSVTVFVRPTLTEIRDRLRQRWVVHGLDREAATLKISGNDLPNAELVLSESSAADLILNQEPLKVAVGSTD